MLQNTWKQKHYTKQVVKELGITQRKHHKNHLRIYKHIIPRSSWRDLTTNDSTNDLDPTDAPKIQKPESRVRKWYKVV